MLNITPLKIVAEEPDLYRLYGRTKDGDVCYSFPMSWNGSDWEFGSAKATLDSKGFWNTPKDADPLLQAILLLHQAIYPKYKFDQSS